METDWQGEWREGGGRSGGEKVEGGDDPVLSRGRGRGRVAAATVEEEATPGHNCFASSATPSIATEREAELVNSVSHHCRQQYRCPSLRLSVLLCSIRSKELVKT